MHPCSEQVEVEAPPLNRPLAQEPDTRSQPPQESATQSHLRQESGTPSQPPLGSGIRIRGLRPAPKLRRRRPPLPRLSPAPTPSRHLLPVRTPGRHLLRAGPSVAMELVVVAVAVVVAIRAPGPCRSRLLFAPPATTCGNAWWGSVPIKGFQGVLSVF